MKVQTITDLKQHQRRRKQWMTLISLLIGWYLYYACRKSFSSTMSHLITYRGFTKEDLGMIASSFSLSYGSSKLFSSIISDHVNTRKLFTAGLLLSGICLLLFPLSFSPLLCSVLWFIFGCVQGVGWPAIVKILKVSCPSESFGIWWSVISSFGNLAATVSPLMIAYVTSLSKWEVNYYLIGGTTVFVAAAIFVAIPESSHNAKKDDNSSESSKVSFSDVFTYRELYIVSILYFMLSIGKYAISDWAQLYFIQHLKMQETSAGACAGMVQLGGVFGNIVWGYISDRTLKLVPPGSKCRRSPALLMSCSLLTICYFMFTATLNEGVSELQVSTLCLLIGIMMDGAVSIVGLIAIECAPDHLSGSAHGIASAFGQAGAFAAGWPFSFIVMNYSWTHAYYCLTLVSIVTVGASIFLTLVAFKGTKKLS